jgi:hypothetical protein
MWRDNFNRLHDRVAERSCKDLASQAPSSARQLVTHVRGQVVGIMSRHGCAHVQIGKSYPRLVSGEPDTAQLHKALKNPVDPDWRMNLSCHTPASGISCTGFGKGVRMNLLPDGHLVGQ